MSTNQPAPKGGKRSTLGTVLLVIVIVAAWWFNQQTPANEPTTGEAIVAEPTAEPTVESVATVDASNTDSTEAEPANTEEPIPEEPTAADVAEEASSVDPTPTSDEEPTATEEPTQAVVPANTPIPQPTATDTLQPKQIDTPLPAPRGPPGMRTIRMDQLPREAITTISLIWENGPFPYRQDDTTFQNREGRLPDEPRGFYREFTVVTPGLSHRGPRRIIEGEAGELYYTDDHYDSFYWVEVPPEVEE